MEVPKRHNTFHSFMLLVFPLQYRLPAVSALVCSSCHCEQHESTTALTGTEQSESPSGTAPLPTSGKPTLQGQSAADPV